MVDERILLPVNSVNDLTFKYSIVKTTLCILATPTQQLLSLTDQVPSFMINTQFR